MQTHKTDAVNCQLPARRGVTLLLVLGLMSMFALLVVTFMVVTTQALRTAEHSAKALLSPPTDIEGTGTSAVSSDLNKAVLKLLVGDDLESVIGLWSILEDMYGHPVYVQGGTETDQLAGTVMSVSPFSGSSQENRWKVEVDINLQLSNLVLYPADVPASLDLAGSVLTISGGSKNLPAKSTRILEYDFTTPQPTLIVQAISDVPIGDIDNTCEFIINGAPFSGTGPGFSPTTPGSAQLGLQDGDGKEFALRPNILAPVSSGLAYKDYLKANDLSGKDRVTLMNPDYTAPDHLHMFLSWFEFEATPSTAAAIDPQKPIKRVIPSFHRPWLVDGTDQASLRKTVLRPLPLDHPNFTGSNPAASSAHLNTLTSCATWLQKGPWDVDSDGDGVADSLWLDIGLPVNANGYKPLVAFLVQDLDGRLNINAHGNYAHLESGFDMSAPDPNGATGSLQVRGGGYGPAEVRLDFGLGIDDQTLRNLFSGTIAGGSEQVVGRYGNEATPVPGNLSDPTDDTTAAFFDFPLLPFNSSSPSPNTVQRISGINAWAYDYESPAVGGLSPDLWGQAALSFDPLGNRVITPLTPGEYYRGNPYFFNPYGQGGDDSPFLAEHMTAILQVQGDQNFGSQQLRTRQLLGEPDANMPLTSLYHHHLTARSSDVPSPSRFLGTDGTNVDWSIYRKVYRIVGDDATKAVQLLYLLPEEIRQGLRVNLNRPSLSQHWVDDSDHLTGLRERAKFAQEIFYLLLVLCYDELYDSTGTLQYTEGSVDVITRLAQWSVNLVDFMDPDATMTPFVFSTTPFTDGTSGGPFDNEAAINDLLTNSADFDLASFGTNVRLLWGMEKPEVAITETLATHNRNVADTVLGSGDPTDDVPCDNRTSTTPCFIDKRRCAPGCIGGGHEEDFDQVLRPEGSVFIELYRCGNPGRSQVPKDLASAVASTTALNMARRVNDSPTGNYVWRLAFSTKVQVKHERDGGKKEDLFYGSATEMHSFQPGQWNGRAGDLQLIGTPTGDVDIERFVWFGSDNSPQPEADGCSYWHAGGDDALLEPNTYFLIGPRDVTTFYASKEGDPTIEASFGVAPDSPDPEAILTLSSPSTTSTKKYMIATDPGTGQGVNVSEPTPGSPYEWTAPTNKPFDKDELFSRGTIPCYRSVFLQRLADPNREHNPVTNPYITVDWSMIDLHVFNSEEAASSQVREEEELNASGVGIDYANDYYFATRQWGVNGGFSGGPPNLWDRNTNFPDSDAKATADLGGKTGTLPLKLTSSNSSLGELNKFDSVTTTTYGTYLGVPNPAFVHFAWNDSPFANTLEVMQVPACSASTFGIQFHEASGGAVVGGAKSLGTGHRFSNENSRLGYLLGFEHSDANTDGTINSLNLARFLEWVHVPSRFAGTIVDWTTDGKPIYAYREPGKINLNTVTETAWEGLRGGYSRRPIEPTDSTDIHGWKPYDYVDGSDQRSRGLTLTRNLLQDGTEVDFGAPFRSFGSEALVPDQEPNSSMVRQPGEAGLFRKAKKPGASSADDDGALFDPMETTPSNMYNEYENVARLSSMTTNRSNVFAVWVTIGYFEATPSTNPNHIGGYELGRERGLDGTSASIKRHRAFYLIDRTVPVGFRRGQELNAKDVIIYSRVLE